MKKTLKSVKINNDLLQIIEKYTSLMKSVFGDAPTFTTMVEEGICFFLLEQAKLLERLSGQNVTFENGTLKTLLMNDEQIEKIQNLSVDLVNYKSKLTL